MEMILDIVVIILIVVMISYAVLLNIKLKTFRNTQNEMATMIDQLNNAITKAQSSVAQLKTAAVTEEERLEELIQKSRQIADELEIITQSGSNLADRIEQGLLPDPKTTGNANRSLSAEDREDVVEDDIVAEDIVEEDHEMLEALKRTR